MRKSQELILNETGLNNKEGKNKLLKVKVRISESTKSVKGFVESIIGDLYLIEKEKLFYFDMCSSMHDFIKKNNYEEKLSIGYASITNKIRYERYIEENKLSHKVKEIGNDKMSMVVASKLTNESEILSLKKYSREEVTKRLRIKHPKTGSYVKRDYKPLNNSVIIRKNFEVKKESKTIFLEALRMLCKQYKAQQI